MIYLNNAATSWPKAPGVADAVRQSLEHPASDVGRGGGGDAGPVNQCRELMRRRLGVADASRIVFTLNATAALNLAIQGAALARGDLLVTTAAEHNSVLRPAEKLRQERGIQVQIVGLASDGSLDEDAFQRALARGPRLVVVSHASNVTGRVFPVGRLFGAAKEAGALTVLDAAQSLGLLPVLPQALHADIVVFTGHKGLLGPAGVGGLYVAPGIDLHQMLVGGTGVRSDVREHPPQMPLRLEAGTHNLPGLAGFAAALEWLERDGQNLAATAACRGAFLRRELSGIPGVQIFDADGGCERVGVVSFRIGGWDVGEAGAILDQSFQIACRAGLHCAPLIHPWIGSAPSGTLRFSVSGFTTEDEISAAAEVVRRLARNAR